MCQIPSQNLCRRLPLIQRNKITTRPSHFLRRPQSLELWPDKWGMKFSAKKCYIMSMRHKSNYFYQLDQHILEQVKTNPCLGLSISDDLQWGSHIIKITSKALVSFVGIYVNAPKSAKNQLTRQWLDPLLSMDA